MLPTVYIETSIISHASAVPSKDFQVSALQQQARQWWNEQRSQYRLVTSQFVVEEANRGDPEAAKRRMELLNGIPVLLSNEQIETVANEILSRALMPAKAKLDALHVAIAASSGVEYLLTLNCKHIANARTLPQVYRLLEEFGLSRILICTPTEFLGYEGHDT
jgi:hypothetical protein